jgi:D-glycerate 3-kinase
MKTMPVLDQFIQRHQLDTDYLTHASENFSTALLSIVANQKQAKQTFLVGINGCQGSGKSTLADYLGTRLNTEFDLNVAVLSLDDFYYSQRQRNELANQVHLLLRTRGVPGTHDMNLANATLNKLCAGATESEPVKLPRFNKFADNPYPQSQWPIVDRPIDIIILEGWCLGVQPQLMKDLIYPINKLEAVKDKYGIWRSYVNQQLKQNYQELYQRIDHWIMLKAPSFDCVQAWRLEQENKRQALEENAGHKQKETFMTGAEVRNFTAHFQRITEQCLATLPKQCDWVYELDNQRNIVNIVHQQSIGEATADSI